MMNNHYYDSKMITKVFWHLLPVQILIATISSINGIIDATIASNFIGPQAIAATGLFFPLTKILDTVNIVLLGGAQIMCGKMLGKNQVERTKGVFTLDMVVVAITSIILTLVGLFFSYPVAKLLGASPVLIGELSMYIVGMAPGFLAYMVVAQLSSFLQLERHAMFAALGIEEMAGNIVEHGFTDNKKHSIDVRVVYTGEELILRIKDDCRAFNPKERVNMLDPEDPTHNIGLRMISKLANDMIYQNTFGLNVLTIHVSLLSH